MDNLAYLRQSLIEFLKKNSGRKPKEVYAFVSELTDREYKYLTLLPGRRVLEDFLAFCIKVSPPHPDNRDVKVNDIIIPAGEVNTELLDKIVKSMKIGQRFCAEMTEEGTMKIYLEQKNKEGKIVRTSLKNRFFLSPNVQPVKFAGIISSMGDGFESFRDFGKNKRPEIFDTALVGVQTAVELQLGKLAGEILINKEKFDLYELQDGTQVYLEPGSQKIIGFKEPGKPTRYV